MTVHVLMPVFNRLALTKRAMECLRAQSVNTELRIVVVDDGSTDGTTEWLAKQPDVNVIQGDGSLWWGGAIHAALQQVMRLGKTDDWVLFVNNDTQFAPDFVATLLDVARSHAPAAVGSVIRDETHPSQLLSIGAAVDAWKLKVNDVLGSPRHLDLAACGVHTVDALSGRGVLFPLAAFHKAGLMRPRWLPHYLADYELSIRIRKAGWRLLVSESAAVLSANEFGNAHKARSLREELFSVRSAGYLPANLIFWWEANSSWGRVTLLPRMMAIRAWKLLQRFVKPANSPKAKA